MDKLTIEGLETYKDLFDHAYDLIHFVDLDGTILFVNKAWEILLEYRQEEIQGRSIYSLLSPRDRQSFNAYRQEVITCDENDKQVVICFLSKSGNEVLVEGSVSVRRQNGEALYTRGIFHDISARVQNERQLHLANEALKEKESNMRQLLTHAPDAIIVINEESIITYWNPKAVTLFGWSSEQALGKNLNDTIIPTQYQEAHNKGMSRYLATGEAHVLNKTVELTAVSKEGVEFYISLTISTTQQHGKRAFIAFIRNIDKEKRNELELEKNRRELQQSNEELEQFAHVASHDIKEPVRKIRFFADQLKLETVNLLSTKAKGFLEKIDNAASRLNNIIEGVLQHSYIGASILQHERINLHEVVNLVLVDLELVIVEKKAVIRITTLPQVEGDRFLIYQLFYNLISNCLKFVAPGVSPVIDIQGNEITVETKNGGGQVEISIRDNGIGFSNEHSEKIFKKFSRLHPKGKFEGTGLGLALCKSILEKHRGSITAFPRKEGGAEFVISLPKQHQ